MDITFIRYRSVHKNGHRLNNYFTYILATWLLFVMNLCGWCVPNVMQTGQMAKEEFQKVGLSENSHWSFLFVCFVLFCFVFLRERDSEKICSRVELNTKVLIYSTTLSYGCVSVLKSSGGSSDHPAKFGISTTCCLIQPDSFSAEKE